MEQSDGNFVLVRQAQVARDSFTESAVPRARNVMVHPEVQAVLEQFAALLDVQRSMAARHRLLKQEHVHSLQLTAEQQNSSMLPFASSSRIATASQLLPSQAPQTSSFPASSSIPGRRTSPT